MHSQKAKAKKLLHKTVTVYSNMKRFVGVSTPMQISLHKENSKSDKVCAPREGTCSCDEKTRTRKKRTGHVVPPDNVLPFFWIALFVTKHHPTARNGIPYPARSCTFAAQPWRNQEFSATVSPVSKLASQQSRNAGTLLVCHLVALRLLRGRPPSKSFLSTRSC